LANIAWIIADIFAIAEAIDAKSPCETLELNDVAVIVKLLSLVSVTVEADVLVILIL
jgi:hypothetical protein